MPSVWRGKSEKHAFYKKWLMKAGGNLTMKGNKLVELLCRERLWCQEGIEEEGRRCLSFLVCHSIAFSAFESNMLLQPTATFVLEKGGRRKVEIEVSVGKRIETALCGKCASVLHIFWEENRIMEVGGGIDYKHPKMR